MRLIVGDMVYVGDEEVGGIGEECDDERVGDDADGVEGDGAREGAQEREEVAESLREEVVADGERHEDGDGGDGGGGGARPPRGEVAGFEPVVERDEQVRDLTAKKTVPSTSNRMAAERTASAASTHRRVVVTRSGSRRGVIVIWSP